MAQQCQMDEATVLLPMIDARRMEVFTLPMDQNHHLGSDQGLDYFSGNTETPSGKKVLFEVERKCKAFSQATISSSDDISVPSAKDMLL